MGQEKQNHGHREPEVPETKVSLTATKITLKIRRQAGLLQQALCERNYQNAH